MEGRVEVVISGRPQNCGVDTSQGGEEEEGHEAGAEKAGMCPVEK